MSGLKLAASYSFYPHQLGLCGPSEEKSRKILFRFLAGEKIASSIIKKILRQFKAAFPYYCLIAKANKIKNPFDRKVIEAYWLGNNFLEKISFKDLKKFFSQNFPHLSNNFLFLSLEKTQLSVLKIRPHHNFHVLLVGSVSGRIYPFRELLEKCLIGWGKVKKIKKESKIKNKVIIESPKIIIKKGKCYLGKSQRKLVFWNEIFLPQLQKNDWVSTHWDWVVQILNQKELSQLKKYTTLALRVFNNLKK